jgi:hypothetical protein
LELTSQKLVESYPINEMIPACTIFMASQTLRRDVVPELSLFILLEIYFQDKRIHLEEVILDALLLDRMPVACSGLRRSLGESGPKFRAQR